MLRKAVQTQRESIACTADIDLELIADGVDPPGVDARILQRLGNDGGLEFVPAGKRTSVPPSESVGFPGELMYGALVQSSQVEPVGFQTPSKAT